MVRVHAIHNVVWIRTEILHVQRIAQSEHRTSAEIEEVKLQLHRTENQSERTCCWMKTHRKDGDKLERIMEENKNDIETQSRNGTLETKEEDGRLEGRISRYRKRTRTKQNGGFGVESIETR